MAARRSFASLLLLVVLLTAGGCGGGDAGPPPVALNGLPLEEIIRRAKEEGQINSVSMPDHWANWKQTWEDLCRLYGLRHTDLDMSSAEELAFFQAEKDAPTKDIGDVGREYGMLAKAAGITLPYKTSYWHEIPAWAKDDRGDWIVCYTGTIVFLINDALVDKAPRSWRELLEGEYKVSLGDIMTASQSQWAFYASALAMGGSLNDLRPGIEFWKEMARRGRIEAGDNHPGAIAENRIPVAVLWDFNALNYREAAMKRYPDRRFSIRVPQDCTVRAGYASIINARAPHPHAAALAREYILSDHGQLNLARGHARPIRPIVLPEDVRARLLPQEEYAGARIVTEGAPGLHRLVTDAWLKEVLPLLTNH